MQRQVGGGTISTVIELPVLQAPTAASEPTARFLRLMADPTRQRIFLQLMRGEICNCEIVSLLGLPQNLISHHLRQLREAGLLEARRDASDQRWIYYSINRAALAGIHTELATVFDPATIGDRQPLCPPGSAVDCC